MAQGARNALGRRLAGHRAELRLGFRTSVAAVITFVVGQILGVPQVYWAVLTAVIVMQASLGASLKAMLDRLAGTLGGGMWGVVVAATIPHAELVSRGIALVVAVAPLAVLAASRSVYRVAPVTAIIVLLGTTSQNAGAVMSAVDRMVDVGLGSIVALAVALLVLPARAHGFLAERAGRALELMADDVVMLLALPGADPAAPRRVRDEIRAAMARVEEAAGESARERAHRLTDVPDADPLVRTLRRLWHDLVMMTRAAAEPLPEPPRTRLAEPAKRVATEVAAFLRAASSALTARAPLASVDGVARALAEYADAMAEIRRDRLTRQLDAEATARVFGLAFALEQMHRDLEDLAGRVREWASAD